MLKKRQVVMLPTNEKAEIFLKGSGRLEWNPVPPLHGVRDLGWTYQHLYFLSDEKIKEGDWYVNLSTKKVHLCGRDEQDIDSDNKQVCQA